MKKTLEILILCAGIFLSGTWGLSAQKRYVFEKQLTPESNTLNYKLSGKQYYYMIVPSGTVFLFDEWKKGYIILANGDRYDDASLRYDIYADELIYINNRTVNSIMLDKNTISEFGLYGADGNEAMQFIKTNFPKNPDEKIYFQQLYGGKIKLLIQHRSFEDETTLYRDQYGYMRNSKFNPRATYYFVFPDDRFEKFKLKRWSVTDLFSGDKERKREVKRLLRQNHINLQTNQELIQLARLIEDAFYNQAN